MTKGSEAMFLENAWQVAAHASQLRGEALLSRRLLGRSVLLFRRQDGTPVAMQDRCPHRSVPLSAGIRIGDEIQCSYHGLRFSPDGRCTHAPGQTNLPPAARLQTYPVLERYGHVWMWMGAPELAHPALLPPLPWLEDGGWAVTSGYLHFGCGHQLVTDNLLDLSHESYLHERTIGNARRQTIADFPVRTTQEAFHLVRAHREMPGISPPPFFATILETTGPIDRWQTAIYAPPGLNMTEAGVLPAGGDRSRAFVSRIMHLLTPETDRTTHYFWALARNYRLADAALDDVIARALEATFKEDKAMLELQQATLSELEAPRVPGFALRVDDAPLRARRLFAAACRRESEEAAHVAPPSDLLAAEGRE
jgi:vanillate O-demethylase monooxygenase subunit